MKRYVIGIAGAGIVAAAVAAALIVWNPRGRTVDLPEELILTEGVDLASTAVGKHADTIRKLTAAQSQAAQVAEVTIDYPLSGSVFPAEIVAPAFLWHDAAGQADRWLVDVTLDGGSAHIYALVAGSRPLSEPIDPKCIGPTNEIYKPAGYDSAHAWTPSPAVWSAIKKHSTGAQAQVAICGFRHADPAKVLSRGRVALTTSKDPVGAQIFYRDVPLMPTEGKQGKIEPLAEEFLGLIHWRLKDIGDPGSRAVLKDMPTCANCHSFSYDGKVLAMDIDGPSGDKGAYAIGRINQNMVIQENEIITWNSWTGEARTGKTIGFLSQISPDGKYVVSTVNESVYVANFTDYRFLQVFYPTRGILVYYSADTKKIEALSGAADPAYVQCDPAWSPDGQWIVFARAAAQDAYAPGRKMAAKANDPLETPVQYDLYKMPFKGGQGGRAVPLRGASANGMSNTFPKVSPDGRWIVFVKCRNGQLMRPDSELWIVPAEGGEARRMKCNTRLMNSWHSFSPNGRWMVFSSKANTPYTRLFLTHLDENGDDTPPILITGTTAGNRAANIPEFVNIGRDDLQTISVPSVEYWTYFNRGRKLAEEGKHTDALVDFRRALKLDPNSARINAHMAQSLESMGRLGEAVERLDEALRMEPDNFAYRTNRGNLLVRLGEPTKAIADLDAAVKLQPASALAWYNRAVAYRDLENWKAALADYDEAIRLNPNLASAHADRGTVLVRQGNRLGAMAAYSEALRCDPKLWWVLYNRGRLKAGMGNLAGAADDLAKCLELAPPDWPGRPDLERDLGELRAAMKPAQ